MHDSLAAFTYLLGFLSLRRQPTKRANGHVKVTQRPVAAFRTASPFNRRLEVRKGGVKLGRILKARSEWCFSAAFELTFSGLTR
jgi:hypothetical protein